jgi:ribosome-associated protein
MENFELNGEAAKTLSPLTGENAKELADAIAEVLDSKKGHDIKVLHVEDKTVIAEYFVLCTGNSSTQVKALADEVDYKTTLRGKAATNVEGRGNVSWIVLDFDNVIVHIFSREAREFYNLDKLYSETTEIKTADND